MQKTKPLFLIAQNCALILQTKKQIPIFSKAHSF